MGQQDHRTFRIGTTVLPGPHQSDRATGTAMLGKNHARGVDSQLVHDVGVDAGNHKTGAGYADEHVDIGRMDSVQLKGLLNGFGPQLNGGLDILVVGGMEVSGLEDLVRWKEDVTGFDLGFVQDGLQLGNQLVACPAILQPSPQVGSTDVRADLVGRMGYGNFARLDMT